MVFRLPSNLESFVPPPSEQHVAQTPWRGSIVVSGIRDSDRNSNQEIFVTAVETDGDNRAQHWPTTFYARVVHERPVLREFQAWLKTCVPASPICTFMPNRLRQADHHAVNQAHFRTLSRILFDNQVIAVAPWADHTFPGAGIIIYPAQNSSAVLVGVPFFYSGFPEFLGIMPSVMTHTPNMMQGSRPVQYQQRIMTSPTYESSLNRHASSVSPHNSDSSSPQEQSLPPYNYMMSRPSPSGYPNLQVSPSHSGWPNVKAEDGHSYPTYPTNNHLSYT